MINRQTYATTEYWFNSLLGERIKKIDDANVVVSRFWNGLEQTPDLPTLMKLLGASGTKLAFTTQQDRRFQCCVEISNQAFAVLDFFSNTRFELLLGGFNYIALMKLIEKVDKYMQDLRGHEKEKVGITFSFLTHNGPRFYYRRVACPTWEEIRSNYTNAEAIEWLINLENPLVYGKLLFWHGEPGTGKTFGIRALLREWRHKADFFYILDPENLFGKSAGYLIETLLQVPERETEEESKEVSEKKEEPKPAAEAA